MDKRIFRLANDYSVTCDFDGQQGQPFDEVTRRLFREVAAGRGQRRPAQERGTAEPAGDKPPAVRDAGVRQRA